MAKFNSTSASHPSRNATPLRGDAHQERLFEAYGIVQVTRYAVESQMEGLDEVFIVDALKAAGRLIDEVAAVLGPANQQKPFGSKGKPGVQF